MSVQFSVTNILNLANYTGIDVNRNSPTFGQVAVASGSRSARLPESKRDSDKAHMTRRLRSRSQRRRTAAVLGGLVLCSVVAVRLTAQQPLPTQFQESTGISIVRVDVTVRDSKGMVVRGLQAKDFTILEDDKPQEDRQLRVPGHRRRRRRARHAGCALLDGLEDEGGRRPVVSGSHCDPHAGVRRR